MAHRPNILKLASKISLESMTYTGITYNDPEYKILDPLVDDSMCEVMMHLRLETNRTAAEVSQRSKLDIRHVQAQLDKLLQCGIIRTRMVDGQTCYYYPIWVPGIMEGILSNREQCDRLPVLGECFEEYTRKRVGMLAGFMDAGMNMMRVIPVESAIENNTRRANYDEIKNLVENAKAISVGPCSCRRARRLMGEGCGHLEEDMCMYLNDNALTYSKSGSHRLITKKEAYEVLQRAEANGLVHELNVAPGFEDASAICNCCGCSCFALRIAEYFNAPDAVRSNYVAKVDKEKCAACGQCVENCQVNAIKLGDRLCDAPVSVGRPDETARNSLWLSESRYNKDYRTTRTDVMDSGSAPCKAACPAHVSVQGYLRLASEGRYREALELIKKDNPLPAVCGRICNKPCEDACTRTSLDEAVAIDDIKRFIAEKDTEDEHRFVPAVLTTTGRPYKEKIAVIGSGPAGIACAYYLAVKGYPVTVFERDPVPGGMLTLGIPSFRLEKDVIRSEIDVLKELGVDFRCSTEVGKDITISQLRKVGYKAFFLGIGASAGQLPSCPGSGLNGVMTSIDFLRRVNLDQAPDLGKKTVIIGGGNVALDAARSSVRLGAETTLVYRRREEDMPADPAELAEAKAEGVRFAFLASPVEILGGDHVVQIRLEKMSVADGSAEGKPTVHGTGEFITLDCNSVISATGQKVELGGIDDVKVSDRGTVFADGETMQTSSPDIFTGGDCFTGPKFAINAIAAGKEAAISIHRYVHEGQTLTLGRDHRDYKPFDVEHKLFAVSGFDHTPRQHAVLDPSIVPQKTFHDLRVTLTEEQIRREAHRCLGCGAAVVNEFMCVGCGICTTKCKFDAIHLEKITDADNQPYFTTLGRLVGSVPGKMGNIAVKHIGRIGKHNA